YIWVSIFPPLNNINDIFLMIESQSFFIKTSLFLFFLFFCFLFFFKSNLVLEWRLLLLKKDIKFQFVINFFNNFFFFFLMFNYIYSIFVYIFINFLFNILLYKINNFIEYSFICKLKSSVYRFSSLITNSFSNSFFKNFIFILIQLFLLISFIFYLEIY